MEDRRLRTYFKQQVREMLRSSSAKPGGFLRNFAALEAKDEEILALVAISTLSDRSPFRGHFATPLDALAALSAPSRAEICQAFRRRLLRQRSVAGRQWPGVPNRAAAENLGGVEATKSN